jgi:hypothetical protein
MWSENAQGNTLSLTSSTRKEKMPNAWRSCSGAPSGKRNGNYRHGHFTTQAKEERRRIKLLIRQSRTTVRSAG